MADIAQLGLEVRSDSVVTANNRLRDFEAQSGRSDSAAVRMGKAVGRAAAQFVLLAGAAFSVQKVVSTLASFEKSMSAVEAITRATGAEMEALRDIARELGATTEFSASQAADGLRFLGMAGFTATESVAAIPAVLNLATAAAMDLGSAADITSNIMSGFGIEARNAADVADVLAAASSRANTDVSQLGQAMSTVAPIAAALDISLADTAAAIGTLSDAGIQGERAGTAMRGVLASLAGPTTQARKVLANLGLTINDVNPATNELATIFGRLRDAGLSTADAMTLFGREAASGALVLVSAADRVGEFGEELSGVTGEAQRMADTMRDNLGGDIQGLISSIEAVILALGDSGLTNALRSVTQIATESFRFIAENMERVLSYATAFAAFFAGPYVVAFVGARIATFNLAAALIGLRAALIRTGIGALVVILGELVYQLWAAIERAGGFGQAMHAAGQTANRAFESIKNGATAMDRALRGVAFSVEAAFRTAWGNILIGFENMMSAITGQAPDTFGAIASPGNLQLSEADRARESADREFGYASHFWDLAMNGTPEPNVPGTPGGRGRGGGLDTDNMPDIPAMTQDLEMLGGALEAANDNLDEFAEALALVDGQKSPFEKLANDMAVLDEALAAGAISWEQYGAAAFRANATAASSVLGLAGGLTSALSQMFQDNKAFAIANAVVSTAEAVMKALATYGPTPWGFAAAGVAAATGAAQIAAIASAQKGSASAPGVKGSAVSQASQPQQTQSTTQINLTLGGSGRYSRDDVRDLLEQMTNELSDGVGTKFKLAVNQ